MEGKYLHAMETNYNEFPDAGITGYKPPKVRSRLRAIKKRIV